MILKMVKKNNPGDKEPLIICVEHNGQMLIKKISIGQMIEVEDELGYVILGQYSKCLVMAPAGRETKEKAATEVK
tara:strand:+ start:861 stop:1085 length:225 start_codon:yes stop_codon:yes gene_type:complete